jgi:hypothetical protein
MCVMGLGAGLLGSICSLLVLLGGLQNERPVSATQPASPLLLRPPGATWGGGAACSPFALVQGAGGHGRIGTGSRTDGLGTPSQCTRNPDPSEGVPATDLANCHAAVFEGRQRGQDRRPQAWVIAERRDVLGEYQGFIDKSLPSNPPTRSSSSSQDRSVPGPHWIQQMSFGPVNQQDRRGLFCSGVIWRFRRSSTTCIDVEPPMAKTLILSNKGRNSGERDGLVLHCLRSSAGPMLGRMRRSLASVLAITQSLR